MGIIVNIADSTGLKASAIAASTQITEQQVRIKSGAVLKSDVCKCIVDVAGCVLQRYL